MSRANSRCKCGSGRKHRNCCGAKDRRGERARPRARSRSSVPPLPDLLIAIARDPSKPEIRSVGGTQIWRPSDASEAAFRSEFEDYVRGTYGRTEYADHAEIVPVLLDLFRFCRERLRGSLQALGSQDAAEFFAFLCAQWLQALEQHRRGELSGDEAELCSRRGSAARRAIEYVLEQLVAEQPGPEPTCRRDELSAHMDCAMIAGEWMVEIAMLVPQTRDLHPDDTTLVLDPDGDGDFFVHALSDNAARRSDEFLNRATTYYADPKYQELLAPDDITGLIDSLGPAFEADHGADLRTILGLLGALQTSCRPRKEGFPVYFVREDGAARAVATNTGMPERVVRRALAGLALRPADLAREPHEPWQPKKARRVVRRPFLSLPHASGQHLCWCAEMLQPGVEFVLQDISFGRLPSEWEGPTVGRRHIEYLDSIRKRWESEVADHFERRGTQTGRSLKTLRGVDNKRVRIEPGEIDCVVVGAVESAVLVVEVKRLQPAYSPPEHADEVRQFRDERYIEKLLAKVDWVRDNWPDVREHLNRWCGVKDAPETPLAVLGCVVTKYESYMQVIDDRVPIVSAARLFHEFDESGKWPFVP